MSQEYQIKLTGQLQAGRAPDQALQLLNDLFQIPVEEGQTLLLGKPTTLPRKFDQITAEQICHRFRNVGVECSAEQEALEDLEYTLELIQEGPEVEPFSEPEEDLGDKLQELTQQLAETEKDLSDSTFVLELIPLEEELEKPLPKVGHIHVPTLSPSLKQAAVKDQAPGASPGEDADPNAPETAAAEAGEAGETSGAEGANEEEIAIGQATAGGSAGIGGMLPQASVQPSFKRPDEILAAKPKSKIPLIAALTLLLLLGGGAGYWKFFMSPSVATAEAPAIAKVNQEPVQIDTSQFTAYEIAETKARLENLAKTLHNWQTNFNANKSLPEQDALMIQLEKELGLRKTDWQDAWGHSIKLQNRFKDYILVSPGLDGKIDTQDDIDLILELP